MTLAVSWVFPRPRNLKPERDEPDSWKEINAIVTAVAARHGKKPDLLIESGSLDDLFGVGWGEGIPDQYYDQYSLEDQAELDSYLLEIRQSFASAAGKHFMVKTLKRLIPPHKVYAEVFCGAAALLFTKDPSEKEIINDKDPEIASAHKAIKSLTDEEIEKLSKKNWVGSPAGWDRMRRFRPVTKLDKLYKFLYITKHSYGSARKTRGLSEPLGSSYFENLKLVRGRLKDVEIRNEDALELIPKVDSKDTWIYLDPPYEVEYAKKLIGSIDMERLAAILSKLKGKFLLSVNDTRRMREVFKQFNVRTVDTRRQASGPYDEESGEYSHPASHKRELLFANYDISKFISESEQLEAKEPVTHEQQREFAERLFGDPYFVTQKGIKKTPFVVQYHLRGIWTTEERKDLLDQIRSVKRTGDHERFKKLWKEGDCSYLLKALKDWQPELQKADDERRDITAIVNKHLVSDPPELKDLDIARTVNKGNAHADLRIRVPGENHLIGWTLTSPRISIMFLESGEVIYPLRDKLLENQEGDKIPAARKAQQPVQWIRLVSKAKPTFEAPKGEVGGTAETGGVIYFKASGQLAFGISKNDYHEYYLWFDNPEYKSLDGRWGFQKLASKAEYLKIPAKKGEPPPEWWMADKVYVHPEPYIVQHRRDAVEKKAKAEGIKKMVYSPDLLKLLASDSEGKKWLGDVTRENLDEVYDEYSKDKGEWQASR